MDPEVVKKGLADSEAAVTSAKDDMERAEAQIGVDVYVAPMRHCDCERDSNCERIVCDSNIETRLVYIATWPCRVLSPRIKPSQSFETSLLHPDFILTRTSLVNYK